MRARLLSFLVLAAFSAPIAAAEEWIPQGKELSPWVVENPSAAPVTAADLHTRERFWPEGVALTQTLDVEGRAAPLPSGTRGVLVRVGPDARLVADFGRDGVHAIPIEATDAVVGANRIRLGEETKLGPNVSLMLGPRLLQIRGTSTVLFGFEEARGQAGFMIVVADPESEGFPKLASAMRELAAPSGVLSVLLPVGRRGDDVVVKRLNTVDWQPAFVFSHMAEAYARALAPEGIDAPAVLIVSSEGRLLLAEEWTGALPEALESVFRDAYPERTASGAD